MDVLEVDISKIIPYEHNNRKHPTEQIQRIAKSISLYGFNQAIVVDENNIIIAGHGRLEAITKM
jgi:ParB-like chromosome segregation protein Spo0J